VATKVVKKKCQLEKFPGKGGWTFARVPEILPDKKAHFGWVKVKGTIDSFELKNYRLMPMGDGTLFLPVRADIRKRIGKKAGDWVLIKLQRDDDPTTIPGELLDCLRDEPAAHQAFLRLSDAQQSREIQFIYSAKSEDLKVDRIAILIRRLSS
jgi:hypothetical protein